MYEVIISRRRLRKCRGCWQTETWTDFSGIKLQHLKFVFWVENEKLRMLVKDLDENIIYEPATDLEIEETVADIMRAYRIPIREHEIP